MTLLFFLKSPQWIPDPAYPDGVASINERYLKQQKEDEKARREKRRREEEAFILEFIKELEDD